MNIAIFPARSGSTRIKNKNFKLFANKPMIEHSIKIAKDSKLFDKIIISTDKNNISKLYKKYGASDYIKRPKNLSDNNTITKPVIQHAIRNIINKKINLNYVCCIYPCTPFLKPEILLKSYNILKKNHNSFVYPIVKFPHPIQRALSINKKNKIKFRQPEYELSKTQDLKHYYHDAGQFYWGSIKTWLSNKNIHSNGFGCDITNMVSVDIDYPEDWKLAEKLFFSINEI